jgi:hypothetical protein
MSILSRRVVPTILVTGAMLLGAGASAGAAATTTTTQAPGLTGTAGAQATALLTSALKATNAVKSLSVSGHGTSGGTSVKLAATAGKDDAFGVLTVGGQTTTIRRVGSVIYQKSTKGFLQKQGASASQAAVMANKWFKITTTTSQNYIGLNQYLSVPGLLMGLIPPTAKGTIASEKASTLNGHPVEVIVGTFQGAKVTLYVASHGTPYVLRVAFKGSSGSNGINIDLSRFNQAVHATAPKGAVAQ